MHIKYLNKPLFISIILVSSVVTLLFVFLLYLFPKPVLAASPYLQSDLITNVTFDTNTHVRLAPGSDNWPITWADDGHQYTSWGDGGGFDGDNSNGRVSLGFARVEGNWDSYNGCNVMGGVQSSGCSSPSAGMDGKSYGIISVNGILYAWWGPGSNTTSYNNTQLLKSTDKGRTWTKSVWDFKNLDSNLIMPTILNFGQDHTGQPAQVAGYVYHYFIDMQDSSSLTVHKPGIIYLARVPVSEIGNISSSSNINSYEFFSGLDSSSNPIWGTVSQKHPVFQDSDGVGWNMSVVYNAGLQKYILTTEHTVSFAGNMGMFESDNPWGPWKTVLYTNNWEGFGSTFFWNFSNKWTSTDGKDFTLVFTGTGGNDSWNTIQGRFDVGETVGKWERYIVSLTNTTYSGNPFELEVDGLFTHTQSGTQITLPGYYDGNNTWKIGFMPTLTGAWTYTTLSTDPELHNQTGTISVIESGLPGMLKADFSNSKKWKFTDGTYVIPIATRTEFFSEPATLTRFTQVADFMQTNNLHIMETRLLEEYGQFGGRYDFIFDGNWQNHQFDLAIWQRFEERLDILAERGRGAHIMFYSDDAGKPGWLGQSVTEQLVIRYVIARTAGYPVIWYNTGIDITEYRSQSDINWLGQQLDTLDPYNHPRSSRYGGGSGSIIMANQNYQSHGDSTANMNTLTNNFVNSPIPVSQDDAWGENRASHPAKNHTPADIRRAFWKAAIAGGVGGLIRGGATAGCYNGFFCLNNYEAELESEQWLKFVNPFIADKLGDMFETMIPDTSLVSGTGMYALSDPQHNKVLYLFIGANDTYDSGGGNIGLIDISCV